MTTLTVTPAWDFAYLDPATLLVNKNTRLDPRLDADFLASVKDDGVLVPILALRTSEGKVRVRDGHRRVLAAIQAGHTGVPVIVTGAEGSGNAAEVERILEQFKVNTHRAGLTAAEQASAVVALFDLEVPAATVQKQTRLSPEQIEAARKVAASEGVKILAAQYPLDLEQTAVLAEFDDDPGTAAKLAAIARDAPGQFAHAAQRARDDCADAAAIAEHTAAFEAKGITVVPRGSQPWEHGIENWAGPDGKQLTPKTHKKCPGNVVSLYLAYGRKAGETWYCTDPQGNGHKRYRSGSTTAGMSSEEASADRRRVLDGNKAWRSAETVRRAWLRDLLGRPKLPDGGSGRSRDLQFILEGFARSDQALHREMQYGNEGRHAMARDLLGIPKAEGSGWSRPPEVWTAMTTASPARAQVIALAIILGASESSTGVDSWRNPSTATADYLEALAGWGYELADIERELVTAARERVAAAAATQAETDAAARDAASNDQAATT